ncbi:sulfonate transport system permease protein [Tamaricihabitans halophyticus]|uniref:Sulfonate transport system permease protein n=1 Tax=Tamaricihabitans halophyticus TaxID=1262583 RepID=A0A4V2SSR4_9PSEU|nr:ABC transporter permease [Tamaricihabitans halophyticus]TCP47886.1 sulfonate transport system permease protein [Tamaricihabitans halophyticus]
MTSQLERDEVRSRQRVGSAPTRSRISTRRLVPARLGPVGLLIGPLALVGLWELAATAGWLAPRQLAAPSVALRTGYQMLLDGELLPHLAASAQRAYLALTFGVLGGTVLALLSGLSRVGEAAIDGLVQVKRAIPTLALIPLAILWLGIGETMKIVVIASSVFVPVYINTHAGLRGIDIRYVELARTTGLSRAEFIRRVALPGALPGFFTGLRLAVTMCWTALVVLEQINATEGIGYIMTRARDYGQTDIIVVGLVIYAVLGLLSDGLVRFAERKSLSWRRTVGS